MIEKLKEILGEIWEGDLSEVGPESVLTADLGLNSMELFDLVCAVEEYFGITIPDRLLPKLLTVGDVVTYLETAV